MALTRPRRRAQLPERPPLGAHMSIAGGVDRAVERALDAGATALQIFLKNASRWEGPTIGADEAERFRTAVARARLAPPVAHAGYLINPASPDPALAERSVRALIDELERAERLGIAGVVLHPGAHMGAGESQGLERAIGRIDEALAATAGARALLYLETTAGQGTTLGYRFEQLAELIARSAVPERLAVCLDTCHVFAAGYGFSTAAEVDATLAAFDRVIGLDRLRVIHVNDSAGERGSRRDRHAHIGQGRIGEEGFAALLRDPRLADVPMILETPKGPDLEDDRRNLAVLRRLAAADGSSRNARSRTPRR